MEQSLNLPVLILIYIIVGLGITISIILGFLNSVLVLRSLLMIFKLSFATDSHKKMVLEISIKERIDES